MCSAGVVNCITFKSVFLKIVGETLGIPPPSYMVTMAQLDWREATQNQMLSVSLRIFIAQPQDIRIKK